jgi:PleD family two-component response regulator
VPYSVSIGVAGIPAELEGLPSIEALLQWADGALYRAKADGRDRVAVAAFGA